MENVHPLEGQSIAPVNIFAVLFFPFSDKEHSPEIPKAKRKKYRARTNDTPCVTRGGSRNNREPVLADLAPKAQGCNRIADTGLDRLRRAVD